MTRPVGSRVLVGCERSEVLAEHAAWLNGRLPSEATRDADHRPLEGDSPIATWARGRRHALAYQRARQRWGNPNNRKRFDRPDDAPPLIDEVDHHD